MATITLTGNMMFGGVFNDTRKAFSDAKKSSSNLAKALNSFKSQINAVCAVSDVSTSVEKNNNSIQRESDKSTALSTAYDKLETFLSDVINVDKNVSEKIKELKEDFYNKYKYLKPDCEKSFWENTKDLAKNLWKGICDIGNSIKKFVFKVADWLSKNWKSLLAVITTIVAVVAFIAVSVVTFGAAAVIIAAVVGAVVGILGQLICDTIAWAASGFKEWGGTWQSYLGAGLGGMFSGILHLWGVDGILSDVLGAGLSTFFSENLENITGGQQRSCLETVFDAILDMSISAIVGTFLESKLLSNATDKLVAKLPKISFLNKLVDKFKCDDLFEDTLTKLTNKEIGNFAIKDIGHGVLSNLWDGLSGNLVQGFVKPIRDKIASCVSEGIKNIGNIGKIVIIDIKIHIIIIPSPPIHMDYFTLIPFDAEKMRLLK